MDGRHTLAPRDVLAGRLLEATLRAAETHRITWTRLEAVLGGPLGGSDVADLVKHMDSEIEVDWTVGIMVQAYWPAERRALDAQAAEVHRGWSRVIGCEDRPTAMRIRLIRERLAEGHSVEDLVHAAEGMASSDWHMERGLLSVGWLYRDGGRVDQGVARYRASRATVADELAMARQATIRRRRDE
mgnify:CR=1 FL=1